MQPRWAVCAGWTAPLLPGAVHPMCRLQPSNAGSHATGGGCSLTHIYLPLWLGSSMRQVSMMDEGRVLTMGTGAAVAASKCVRTNTHTLTVTHSHTRSHTVTHSHTQSHTVAHSHTRSHTLTHTHTFPWLLSQAPGGSDEEQRPQGGAGEAGLGRVSAKDGLEWPGVLGADGLPMRRADHRFVEGDHASPQEGGTQGVVIVARSHAFLRGPHTATVRVCRVYVLMVCWPQVTHTAVCEDHGGHGRLW